MVKDHIRNGEKDRAKADELKQRLENAKPRKPIDILTS